MSPEVRATAGLAAAHRDAVDGAALIGMLRDVTTNAQPANSALARSALADVDSTLYWLAARHRWMDTAEIAVRRQRWAVEQHQNPLAAESAACERAGAYLKAGDIERGQAVIDRAIVAVQSAQLATTDRYLAVSIPARNVQTHARTDRYTWLADPALDGKNAVLAEEIRRVCQRRSNLNDALAWAAARWSVDQAVAVGATVIYLEDLRSMEAGGMGRTQNTRISQTVRGQIADRMRHLAAEVGIAVVTVPPRNTSKHCPHCLTPLRHRKAPNRPTVPGWK